MEDCRKKNGGGTGKYSNDIFHIDKVPPNAISVEVFTQQFEQLEKEKTCKNSPKNVNKKEPKR